MGDAIIKPMNDFFESLCRKKSARRLVESPKRSPATPAIAAPGVDYSMLSGQSGRHKVFLSGMAAGGFLVATLFLGCVARRWTAPNRGTGTQSESLERIVVSDT